jgi:hypothetical protein
MADDKDTSPMPIERLIGILKYRGMDAEALLLAQQRNIRTFVDAQEAFARGIEGIAGAQADMVQKSVERASEAIPELAKHKTLQGLAQAQLEYQREAATAAMQNLQQMSDLVWNYQRSTFDLVNRTVLETVRNLSAFGPNGAAEGKEKK